MTGSRFILNKTQCNWLYDLNLELVVVFEVDQLIGQVLRFTISELREVDLFFGLQDLTGFHLWELILLFEESLELLLDPEAVDSPLLAHFELLLRKDFLKFFGNQS